MKVEPTGEIVIDLCSVQTFRCKASTAPAPITTVLTYPKHTKVKVCAACIEENIRKGEWEIEGAKIRMRADAAVYSAENKLVMIAEVKWLKKATPDVQEWATAVHRNLLVHSAIPFTPYFMLVAPPDYIFLWTHLPYSTILDTFTEDTVSSVSIPQPFLPPYLRPSHTIEMPKDLCDLARRDVNVPDETAFIEVFADWLKGLTQLETDGPEQKWLHESGLHQVIKNGFVSTQVSVTRELSSNAMLTALEILCDAALSGLPAVSKDIHRDNEARRELALSQLLRLIQSYTGSFSMRLGVPEEFTASQRAEFQIYRFLEHEWGLYGDDKKKLILNYLTRALDK